MPLRPHELICSLTFVSMLGCATTRGTAPESMPPPQAEAKQGSGVKEEKPPTIRVLLSDDERAKLRTQIQADLEFARAAAALRPAASDMDEASRQRWETLAHYIEQAEAADASEDLLSASDLALKARLLAEELRSH